MFCAELHAEVGCIRQADLSELRVIFRVHICLKFFLLLFLFLFCLLEITFYFLSPTWGVKVELNTSINCLKSLNLVLRLHFALYKVIKQYN